MTRMIKPTVSVILPITKESPHLLPTLESLRTQTYKSLEILCGNASGSKVVSKILRRYAKRRKYVRIIRVSPGTNKRVVFNTIVAKARGRFIAAIDVGDIATKTRIAKQVSFLTDNADIVAVGGQQRLYKKYAHIKEKQLPLNHEDIYALSFLSLALHLSTIMVNKNKLSKSFRWYNQSLDHIQDFDLIFHLLSFGKLANLPETVSLVHSYHPLKHAYEKSEHIARGFRAMYHAITRYGLTPSAKGVAQATMRFFI